MSKPDSNGPISRRGFVGQMAVGVAGLTITGAKTRRLLAVESNPFAYDLGDLAKTDPKLIGYEEIKRLPALPAPARHIEIGPEDTLYAAAGNSILGINRDGVRALEIPLGAPARCVAAARDGTIYAGLRDRILSFDRKGNRLASWESPGAKTWFTGLAVAENELFAADAGNRIVLRYDRSGKLTGRIGEKSKERNVPGFVVPSPYLSVKLHRDGLLRVNNPGRHRMEVYTPTGDFEGSWGTPSAAIGGFCGCCNPINFAILPDGRLVTCEKGLPRVKVYGADGAFESVVAGTEAFAENAKVGAGDFRSDASLAGLDAAVDSQDRIYIFDLVTAQVRVMQRKEPTKA